MLAGVCQLKYLCTERAPAEDSKTLTEFSTSPLVGHKQWGARAGVPALGRGARGRGGSNAWPGPHGALGMKLCTQEHLHSSVVSVGAWGEWVIVQKRHYHAVSKTGFVSKGPN